MKSYRVAQIQEIFDVFRDEETLLIHSALQNLGRLEGEEFARIPHIWRDFCLDLSAHHTLIVPSFNYDFPKTRHCDSRTQTSVIGILNELLRQMAKFRSNHPMFNFVGFGKNAKTILAQESLETNPFGRESVFHRTFLRDALMLFLGIDLRVCTFIVYVEAMCGAKYRFLKPFLGELITMEGARFEQEFYHFCRPLDDGAKVSFMRLQRELLDAGILRFFPLGASGIYALKAQEAFKFIQNRLKAEPFFLLTNPPKAYYHFINGEEVQVESLGGGGAFSSNLCGLDSNKLSVPPFNSS
ncbi:AAC(3) family N-acetyltransferase [Helicobacter sp. MIT 05-5294]|uniref:AAC(3) family N-acetyltransferase n=1 Tax=Helicobacter sp. MIT 05-5294 TaxID=1548150 RepID=UPI0010FE6CD6|nr:AAC(3) family N-acetyltransferase [Helicobacter sp. MIT 05-5294]TLD85951.1 aminoglycoside N(3)-acetyltransferase [Helicobacter sp. MIT 05-5294]